MVGPDLGDQRWGPTLGTDLGDRPWSDRGRGIKQGSGQQQALVLHITTAKGSESGSLERKSDLQGHRTITGVASKPLVTSVSPLSPLLVTLVLRVEPSQLSLSHHFPVRQL